MIIKVFILTFFSFWYTSNPIKLDSTYTESELNKILITARAEIDHKALADVYFKLAEVEANENVDPVNAFEYYTRSLDYYKILADTMQINMIKERIAHHYKETELYDEAHEIFDELLTYYRSKKDLKNEMKIAMGISEIYDRQLDMDNERKYIDLSKQINNEVQDTLFMIEILLKEAENYESLNLLDSASATILRAFTLSTFTSNDELMAKSLFHLGFISQQNHEHQLAKEYLLQSLQFETNRKYNDDKLRTFKELAIAYNHLGEYEDAYVYSEFYNELKDSILNHARVVAINNINKKYEYRESKAKQDLLALERDKAINETNQQRRALTALTIGFGLLSLALYYIMRFYSQKIKSSRIIGLQKEQINEQKIRELEGNIQIKGMQSMIDGQEIERERIAKDLHDSLGGLLSTIKLQFENVGINIQDSKAKKEHKKANKLIDYAVDEVRNISRNLQPGALKNLGLVASINDLLNRFQGDNYPDVHFQHYDLPKDMPVSISLSIYRIIQEMLNNAIKHSKAKEILIQLTKEEDDIVILFEDDGIGFDIDKLEKKGMGLDNIQSRIDYLKGSLHIDSRIGEGTTFMVHINPKLV